MRWVLVAAVLFASTMFAAAEDDPPVFLYAQDIPSSELVGLLYREIFRKQFVTSPKVQADRSLVSVTIEGPQSLAVKQAKDYLAALGFVVVEGLQVDRIELPKPVEVPPPQTVAHFYSPKYRSAVELSSVLRPLFPDAKFSGGTGSEDQQQADKLVVYATKELMAHIRPLLGKLDTPLADLVVKAAVYEVGTDGNDGSAFQLAVSLLSGDLKIGIEPSSAGALGSFLSIKSSSIEAVASALSTDGRFKLVTSPTVRSLSGSSTRFSVGESVPVLGSVSYPEGGGSTPVQSIEYRDAGVIFTVRPLVQDKAITLDLEQEISDFVKTTTGVNNTPTLTKRALTTKLSLEDGDVVMLGGLTKVKDSNSREGFSFLPDVLKTNRKEQHRTDLLLVLQVQRLKAGDAQNAVATSVSPLDAVLGTPEASPQVYRAIRSGAVGLF